MAQCESMFTVKGWGRYQCALQATDTVFCAGRIRHACKKHADQCRKNHGGQPDDMRTPGEAFCFDCPDHEACASGYPCSIVKSTNRRKTS